MYISTFTFQSRVGEHPKLWFHRPSRVDTCWFHQAFDMNTCWEQLESHIQPWCGKITLWKGNNFDQGRYFFRYIWSWNRVLDEVDLGRELLLICWIILYPLCRTVDRGFNVNDRCWKVPGKLNKWTPESDAVDFQLQDILGLTALVSGSKTSWILHQHPPHHPLLLKTANSSPP